MFIASDFEVATDGHSLISPNEKSHAGLRYIQMALRLIF